MLEFFETSTRNLLDAESAAGIGHHVVLSIVGTDRLPDSGYYRAKLAQEKLVTNSSIPYSIVHATQFFEFIQRIADSFTTGDTVRVPPVLVQPMAADDVASAIATVSVGAALSEDPDRQLAFLQELLAQRATISGDVIAVGAHTWAIHGSISVDGEVIMAEYDNPDQARLVLGELSAVDEEEAT